MVIIVVAVIAVVVQVALIIPLTEGLSIVHQASNLYYTNLFHIRFVTYNLHWQVTYILSINWK